MFLEICCGDLESVAAAREGGATRIELCSGLAEGGLTPSAALIKAAVNSGIPEINILIRPRPGDFLYSEKEISLMCDDIENAVRYGATGVVIGALTEEGEIDVRSMEKLISAAKGLSPETGVTFHRAFDLSRDADASLNDIISLGCDTLLTSGMASSAPKGIPMLKRLVDKADNRITIMAGGGINTSNASDIIDATGVGAIHSTARKPFASRMKFRRPNVSMGIPGADEYSHLTTSPQIVSQLLNSLNR